MHTITLPDELNIDSSEPFMVYMYESARELSKQQIILNKNTFSFLQEGTKEVFFDNSAYAITNSQFLLMKSSHCLMTEKLSNPQEQYTSVLFFFSNEAVLSFIRKFELNRTDSNPLYSTYSFNYDSFIKRFVNSLIDISKLSKSIQKNILEAKFEEIMLYLIEINGVDFVFSLISNGDNQNQKFIQTMENNILNKLTIKELSFLCNMSISTFKRKFEKSYGVSPIKWFQNKRLEQAAYILKQNKKRPSDIYEEMGYENLSNFIVAFKTKFGVTPKQHQAN